MSSSLIELLSSKLSSQNVSQISQELGASETETKSAIGAALPLLIGALSRNGQTEKGAMGIMGAIDRDHDGSVLDDIGGFLSSKQYDQPRGGSGILGHLLGGRQDQVTQGVSQASGLSNSNTNQLMKMLAPMVMGALSKKKQSGGLDAAGLMGFLGQEKEGVEKQGGSFIGRLLDQDGDGDFDLSDVASLAMNKLFGK